MSSTLILALLGSTGIFLLFTGLVMPRQVRLAQPTQSRGLSALQARLDAAELPVTAREFVMACLVIAGLAALMAVLLGAPALALAGLIIGPALLWQRYETQRDTFRRDYDEALSECLQLLREGFGVTGSVPDALDHAARNGPDPAAADLREVWSAQVAGMGLEDAFAVVVARRRDPYLRMAAEALTLKQSEGGSISEVLHGLETMVREQVGLQREIIARQTQARLESLIISLAPLGFFVAIKVVPWMQDYEAGFYATAAGQIVLTVAVLFSAVAFLAARWLAMRGLTLNVKEVAI